VNVNDPSPVYPNVELHPEVLVLTLARLRHLWIARLGGFFVEPVP